MDDRTETGEQISEENFQEQLHAAKEEIQNLTQQLNCLLVLTKNAWHGDESATLHLARVIGVNAEMEQNAFVEKKTTERSSTKKTVTIAENDDVISKQTPSIASSASQENLNEPRPAPAPAPVPTVARNSYLQPFLKQSHIDPIREEDPRRIFNSMLRYRQKETRKPPVIPNRSSPTNVRPRATRHLYRPASAEHAVRHLGSPLSRTKPYFVFAGKEFFQQTATTSQSPLYHRGSNGSRQSNHSDFSEDSEVVQLASTEQVLTRPQTAKSLPTSTLRFGSRSLAVNDPPRVSSALSSTSSTRLSQLSERERRDAMRLQRQLNLPRQGWLNQYS